MNNLNDFLNSYIVENKNIISEKNNILETFRKKEDELKYYDELLSELEKKKFETNLETFKNIHDNLYIFLSDFNPEDITDNKENVLLVLDFLSKKQHEFNKIAEILFFVKRTWQAFIDRRLSNKTNAKFLEEIDLKLEKLYKSFYQCTDKEINRVEEEANDLKQDILKIISTFEDIHILLEKNIFVGKEATLLKKEIEFFLDEDFYTSSIMELIKRKENLNEMIIEIISNETVYVKKALPVIKLRNVEKKDLYFYTVEFDDYVLSDKNIEYNKDNFIKEHINKFIYIDSYPEKGIFKIEEIKNNISISEDQFKLMVEFEKKSSTMFYFATFFSLILSAISILSIINVFLLLSLICLICIIFYFNFFRILKNIEKKYQVEDSFFFIPINFYIISIGDLNFNYKELIFNILINSDKTILKNKEI